MDVPALMQSLTLMLDQLFVIFFVFFFRVLLPRLCDNIFGNVPSITYPQATNAAGNDRNEDDGTICLWLTISRLRLLIISLAYI